VYFNALFSLDISRNARCDAGMAVEGNAEWWVLLSVDVGSG
jgi:hypothetical protein